MMDVGLYFYNSYNIFWFRDLCPDKGILEVFFTIFWQSLSRIGLKICDRIQQQSYLILEFSLWEDFKIIHSFFNLYKVFKDFVFSLVELGTLWP